MARFKTKRLALQRTREIAQKHRPSQLVGKAKNPVIQYEFTYGGDPERYPS
jgi:hypothetical protein